MGKMFHMYQWWSWDEHLGFGPPALPEDRPLHGVPGLPERVDWGPVEVEDNEMRDGRIADWAIERLQRDYDQPFFLAPGFMKPHTPFYAPPEYFDMFPLEDIVLPEVKPDDLEDIPEAGRNMRFAQMDALIREHGAYPEAVQGYLAATAYMDAQLGRVLDALDASPHADNTVVMLWSDHGFNLGEKHTFSKFNIWEEACRVPLVIKAPGVTTPGTVCTRPVSLIDLYPTLVELTGVREQAPLDGASLVPLLKDPDLAWEQPALTTMFRGNHSLRTERWRYIRYADGSEELYDMENDPMCWDNLAKDPQYDEVKAKLARWLPAKDAEAIPAVDRETYTEWQQEWREHMQWRREWDERLRGGGPVE
jgi:arylsulfatase A-like enzyme